MKSTHTGSQPEGGKKKESDHLPREKKTNSNRVQREIRGKKLDQPGTEKRISPIIIRKENRKGGKRGCLHSNSRKNTPPSTTKPLDRKSLAGKKRRNLPKIDRRGESPEVHKKGKREPVIGGPGKNFVNGKGKKGGEEKKRETNANRGKGKCAWKPLWKGPSNKGRTVPKGPKGSFVGIAGKGKRNYFP